MSSSNWANCILFLIKIQPKRKKPDVRGKQAVKNAGYHGTGPVVNK